MTRLDLLRLLIGRARSNGFEFRRWYTLHLGMPWAGADKALHHLEAKRHYYALLFSHEFALCFWKPGSEITFQVEAQTFQRRMADGTIATVHRKPFTRRSARRDAWRFHLREMALAEEPLRYIRRYLNVEEHLCEDVAPLLQSSARRSLLPGRALPGPGSGVTSPGPALVPRSASLPPAARPQAASASAHLRRLPQELPAFLRRPYAGKAPTSGSGPTSGSDPA